ncbi:MAG TPA: tRNA (adenosine(37)-N6)-threonylcarbamoyltransferase complex dimerization subunit type 1 TsaB [Candidatus Saccharimonadales bacterium]|nr:tRNA (adenosine(37)-N6)-threonylcarbamoyltransferase complex dimerization subunit type 1 TsaB [Candidatus Saccharimonadales bacterium]
MIVLLDTSSPVCKLTFVEKDWHYSDEWQADRELAKHLLAYLQEQLEKNGRTWNDLTGIGVFKGPGSFTGLRIGLTVLNTLANTQEIPIIGETGEAWRTKALERLSRGENDKLVLPLYGSDAHITKPRK